MYRRILVPIDGSDAACQGLDEAIRLAGPWASTLRLLHVVCAEPSREESIDPADLEGYRRSLLERARNLLRSAASTAGKAGVTVETRVGELAVGRPAKAILDDAVTSGCDLIVMGTHGRSGLGHAVIGTNAEEVVRKSRVPVLTVHPTRVARVHAVGSEGHGGGSTPPEQRGTGTSAGP
jgi:nucleotide-binding universal stress UspA family protein